MKQPLADILFTAIIFIKNKTPAQMFSCKLCENVNNNSFYVTPHEDCFCTFISIVILCKMMGSASAAERYDKCTQYSFLWTCFATTLNYFHKNIWWQVTGDLS